MKRLLSLSALILSLCNGGAQATLVYSNNFDGPAYTAPGVSASGPSGGFTGSVTGGPYTGSNGKSWSGSYFGSGDSSTLTLSNLPGHTQLSIDMMLGFLNSWDSRNGTVTPDNLEVWIDGTLVLDMTTDNASGSVVDFDGGTLVVDNGQIDGSTFYSDDLVDMATAPALTLAHSASTLTLQIAPSGSGWQGWPDEGWGIDDLRIHVTGGGGASVPEPAGPALFGLGLVGMGLARRRARV